GVDRPVGGLDPRELAAPEILHFGRIAARVEGVQMRDVGRVGPKTLERKDLMVDQRVRHVRFQKRGQVRRPGAAAGEGEDQLHAATMRSLARGARASRRRRAADTGLPRSDKSRRYEPRW